MDRFTDNAQQNAYDNLEEYVRQREPDAQAKGSLWQTAIGLQAVDGLVPSDYLLETAKRNIDGEISLGDAKDLVHAYYASRRVRESAEPGAEEADKVSVKMSVMSVMRAVMRSPMSVKRRTMSVKMSVMMLPMSVMRQAPYLRKALCLKLLKACPTAS